MMSKVTVFCFGIFSFLAFACLVSSAGVALPYWQDNPLQVYAGQSGCFDVSLQNNVGEEDLIFDLTIAGSAQFVSMDKTEYYVAAHTTDVVAQLCYSIPENVKVGETYSVSLSTRTRSPNTEGGIEVGVGMDRSIPIVIVEKPASTPSETGTTSGINAMWYVLLVVVVIALVLWFVMKKRKK